MRASCRSTCSVWWQLETIYECDTHYGIEDLVNFDEWVVERSACASEEMVPA